MEEGPQPRFHNQVKTTKMMRRENVQVKVENIQRGNVM
jgi:hypothetical protein